MPSNIEKISPHLEIRHKSSMVYGVRRCVSHDILDLLLFVKCQNVKHLDYGGGSKKKNLT